MNNKQDMDYLQAMVDSQGDSCHFNHAVLERSFSSDDVELLFKSLLALSYYEDRSPLFTSRIVSLTGHSDPYIRAMAMQLLIPLTEVLGLANINNIIQTRIKSESHDDVVESMLFVYFSINDKDYVTAQDAQLHIRDSLNFSMRNNYDLYFDE